MEALIKTFDEIHISDIAQVGGKNASLGEMYNEMTAEGIAIPNGFATTAFAYWEFLRENDIENKLVLLLKNLDRKTFSNLSEIGNQARKLILSGQFSRAFSQAIISFYGQLCGNEPFAVAVRSSATAEDLPEASFAGQHDTFLNISGTQALLAAVKDCFASLYTDRAIKYREDKGFGHGTVALSVGVQKMVRADVGCSGVGFTLEPESGFQNIIHLSGVWGLGENIVQGTINPDEFYVFKPTLELGKQAIIEKKLGSKALTLIYAQSEGHSATMNIPTPQQKQEQYVLKDSEVTQLAKWALAIERHYGKPMDIEWAKDGITQELYIIQARPETVHSPNGKNIVSTFSLTQKGKILVTGNAVGTKIRVGTARILTDPQQGETLQKGDIIVTDTTSPDWDPLLKKAGGIITNRGGRTSHAAIVARELGVPAVVGSNYATQNIKDGQLITISCAEGKVAYVFEGALPFIEEEINFSNIAMPHTEVKLILSDPQQAYQYSFYPNNGVGLLRMEFIITHNIKIHPMALLKYDEMRDSAEKETIAGITRQYEDKAAYFIEKLSEGIATMAAAFYPKEVIVRTSDFKTNEYANLIGGKQFEPKEENPMLGFRGAARYFNPLYQEGFELECRSIKRVRDEMGLTNVKIMIPFCRTLEEAQKVIALMQKLGLERGVNGLQIYMMVEIPSNVIIAESFAEYFDGFSIGSNDLTQLTLGVDRDSQLLAGTFDENDPAVRKIIAMAIEKANAAGIKIGLCGQAPSDFPAFASFLIEAGIDSISYNPDALLRGIENMVAAEEMLNFKKISSY
ncbi:MULTISPECIES: phosphoenolpyruvate synthase [Aequorivita]|uniref:Phosphoenolpyruvate synthase n=1 Tax=Aequorivita iocasae TaxID=2803865 RepID=A0ABX7DQ95_9FLAO|nr:MULTISPECIES: phosphoenolpyruvate synthase [Aequorivita]QQX76173.1 phosphoenolpyruvate synthase [Aequorivita iocasae]UCA55633.1 phosphoenolpyruvate synthase [Aequorivita sp. F7]